MATQTTVVSPDVVEGKSSVVMTPASQNNATVPDVKLVAMPEWKQAGQRGVRSGVQVAIFLIGGGTVTQWATGLGIPPASVANLPSTGTPIFDALLFALFVGVFVFLWNMAEFVFDMDLWAPKWRA